MIYILCYLRGVIILISAISGQARMIPGFRLWALRLARGASQRLRMSAISPTTLRFDFSYWRVLRRYISMGHLPQLSFLSGRALKIKLQIVEPSTRCYALIDAYFTGPRLFID